MALPKELNTAYLRMASEWAKLSSAKRRKVGCLIVKNGQIISDGYNGTLIGASNICEDSNGVTKRDVLHAESNAITKLARTTQSSEGSTVYVTLSPCFECAKLLIQSGVERVVYHEKYHDVEGLHLLKKNRVKVTQVPKL